MRVRSIAASGQRQGRVDGRERCFFFAAIRLYRDTDFYGAWVCIPLRRAAGVRWVYNLGHFRFNNGAGRAGYGQAVARTFKSIGFSTSRCTNPV